MFHAAKRKSSLTASLAAFRVLLLLLACCGLHRSAVASAQADLSTEASAKVETRVWGFAPAPQLASSQIAFATPSFIGKNYDAPDSLVVAKTGTTLPADIAASFRGGNYGSRVLQSDVEAFRFSSGISAPEGRFLTTRQTATGIATPQEAIQTLNLPAGATAEQLNTFIIPGGTRIFYGRVEGGSARAGQIFIENPNALRPAP